MKRSANRNNIPSRCGSRRSTDRFSDIVAWIAGHLHEIFLSMSWRSAHVAPFGISAGSLKRLRQHAGGFCEELRQPRRVIDFRAAQQSGKCRLLRWIPQRGCVQPGIRKTFRNATAQFIAAGFIHSARNARPENAPHNLAMHDPFCRFHVLPKFRESMNHKQTTT